MRIRNFIIGIGLSAILALSPALSCLAAGTEETTGNYHLHKDSNVDTIHATTQGALPCVGDAKILVFYTDFKSGEENLTASKEDVEKLFFAEEGKTDSTLAYKTGDSLRSYYYRSSYGKVDISGAVYEYQTENAASYYTSYDALLDEIIEANKDTINWEDYDGNNDGYVDGIYLLAKSKHSFDESHFVDSYSKEIGGKKIAKMCFADSTDMNALCRETAHMFGLSDICENSNMNPAGIPTASIMEKGNGDLPAPAKFVLGWLSNVTFVDSSNAGTFNLGSISKEGDTLVIYPNGDQTNKNWFYVEYVTKEGNNNDTSTENPYGMRVWRTQMNLDDKYNIAGSDTFCNGTPASPFEYIEVLQPEEEWNYYYQTGDSITPYTYPSTAYSDTFDTENGDKFLKDLLFSGISVKFDKVEAEKASFTVKFEKRPTGEVSILEPDTAAIFMDGTKKVQFVTIKSTTELAVNGNASLETQIGNKVINLEYEISKNKRTVTFSMAASAIAQLSQYSDWTFVIPNISSYYGLEIDINEEDLKMDFSAFPSVLYEGKNVYSLGISAGNANPDYFKSADNAAATVVYNRTDKKLYLEEYNFANKKTEKKELEVPSDFALAGTDSEVPVVWKDGNRYFVYFENKYILSYQDDKLSGSLDLTEKSAVNWKFIGADGQSYFYDVAGKKALELKVDDKNVLSTQELGIEAYENDIAVAQNAGKYYVFTIGDDLQMDVYDSTFNKLNSVSMVKGVKAEVPEYQNLSAQLWNNSWLVTFTDKANMYAAVCSFEGKVTNYLNSDDVNAALLPLTDNKTAMLSGSEFSYVYVVEEHEHTYKIEPNWEKTDDGYTVTATVTCESCDYKVEALKGAAVKDAANSTAPTCKEAGKDIYLAVFILEDGTEFDVQKEDILQALGHKLIKVDKKEATCTQSGNSEYWYCELCKLYYADEAAAQEIKLADTVVFAKGHELAKVEAKEATCTEAGNIEHWYCEQCKLCFEDENAEKEIPFEETQIAALEHKLTKIEAKDPTCVEVGNTEHWSCELCKLCFEDEKAEKEIKQEDTVIAVVDHKYEETEEKDPTARVDGYIKYTCSVCEDSYEKTIPAYGTTDLEGYNVILGRKSYTYNGEEREPGVTVSDADGDLVQGVDYTVEYKNNIDAGTATVVVTGINEYDGELVETFKINKASSRTSATVESLMEYGLYIAYGEETPIIVETTGDGKITYSSSDKSILTVNAKGVITAKKRGTAIITVTVQEGKNYKTSKTEIEVDVTLAIPEFTSVSNKTNGVKLEWKDVKGAEKYRIFYNTTDKGWRWLTDVTTTSYTHKDVESGKNYYYMIRCINEKGTEYTGAYDPDGIKFRYIGPGVITSITNVNNGVKIQWKKVAGAKGYNINRKTESGKYSTIKTITKGTTTSFINTGIKNENGVTYTYYVRPYYSKDVKGSYTSKKIVRLVTPNLTSLKNSSSKKIAVKWEEKTKVSGYQIQYSTSSSFKSSKTILVSGQSKTSRTVSGLTKNKRYYVRLRTYKTISGTKYYSSWSSSKNLKITK